MTEPTANLPEPISDPDAHLPRETRPGQAPAGWRPDHANPAMERWWTGRRWYGDLRPRYLPQPAYGGQVASGPQPGQYPPQGYGYPPAGVFVQQVNTAPRYVSGMSNGMRIVHIVLTVCTVGLWAPIWIISEWLGRKRIG